MSDRPLVSCVMPTADRRAFVGQAIRYFLRQDYGARELIVIDDGDEDVGRLIPRDERIRYVRLQTRRPLGAKLNLGCELARGELIAHWDDDDWIGSDRLSRQVAALAGGDACGLVDLLTYQLETGRAWRQGAQAPARGTLLYRRELWSRQPFRENAGRDADLVPGDAVRASGDGDFYIALIHAGNAGRRVVPGTDWTPVPLSAVSERLGLDRAFYAGLRNGDGHGRKRAKERARAAHTLTVAAPFMLYDGYGGMAEYLVCGLARAGAAVNVAPFDIDRTGLSPEFLEILGAARPEIAGPVLYFSWPRPDLERFRGAPDLFINTMWETSRLPAHWPARLNEARAVIVPSRFVAGVCRASGVEVPIEVVPEGVDPGVYGYVERPAREGLTTLVVATYVQRKNTDVAVAAWKRAFAGDPSARLIVKSRFGYGNYAPDDPRIELVDASEPTRGIARWYARADVLLALGSEGFGLPLVEAMATGLPAIALDSEGQSDTCADARELLLPVPASRRRAYEDRVFGSCGTHGAPSVEDVAQRLRWIAGHRDEARELGRAASRWVRAERDVWAKAPAVLDIMEARVAPRRPLRRLETIWVPSAGTPCGLAEHAARITEQLPGVALTAEPPDLRRVRVLHIEHEPSLHDEGRLAAVVRAAREQRVPVVVSEHTVTPVAHAWERDADVLIATTAEGAKALRERWRGKWVEHIPLGCPTWFPPRKRTRGKVIGAYGLFGAHKGFARLLELLPRLPGAELLLVSHDRDGAASEWEAAAAGLPVRRVSGFLPEHEAAAVLAAEADVLVYFYDELAGETASAAARLGLSTGVPVLTSPTRRFADLRDVTYQPADLAAGVERLLEDDELRERLVASARAFCEQHNWPRTSERIRALWRALEGT
ncbi:MAG TPA: glycosyltransferase [Conexibacter sp.]|jgi:glycosyltransferase involved in cell wall biosynthesis